MRWLNLLFVLCVNAVPLVGIRAWGWSATTVLALYWLENLLVAAFTCIRIAAHRRLTRKRGHWRPGQLGLLVNGKPSTSGLLGEYATMAFVFTLAHGIFVAMIVVFAGSKHPDDATWQFSVVQFGQGAGWISLVLALELAIDLTGMRSLSYAALKAQVQAHMGRIFVLHLTIILGMFAMMATDSFYAVLYALIAFKTLWELATVRSGHAKGAAPPAAAKGKDAQAAADAERIGREDEQVMPA